MTDAKAAKAILLPQGTSSTVQPVIQNAMDIFTSSGTAQASFNVIHQTSFGVIH